VVGDELGQLWFEDRRDLGRPARKGIHHDAVPRVELDGGQRRDAQCFPDKAVRVLGVGQGCPDDRELLCSSSSSTTFVSETSRQGHKFRCQRLAGLAPRGKNFQDDQLVGEHFHEGSVFFFGGDVIQAISADFREFDRSCPEGRSPCGQRSGRFGEDRRPVLWHGSVSSCSGGGGDDGGMLCIGSRSYSRRRVNRPGRRGKGFHR